ncbi:helix-turn-helix transcriptional regulator [Dysgonomonas sp. ZJ279]|uniref:S24 family peptidase n=1 Tax=Dysgonomonas sp. ZJ279 TaxID=2709796 RepID=UPI0013E9FAAE|nr:S24 family peptidase [Dysgonomonas sp. ZJ279]
MKTIGSIILNSILANEKINANQFAESIGLSRTQPIYDILNGKVKKITPNYARKILSVYSHYDYSWLISGEGKMLKQDLIILNTTPISMSEFKMIPLVPIRARAGYLSGYGDGAYIQELPTIPVITDRTFHGKYMCFEVEGDSMDNDSRSAICDGDIILGREVKKDLWRCKLYYRDWYFVIVHKEGIMIKQIVDHDMEKGTITCHSLNPIYGDDFKLQLNDVHELYNVIKIADRSMRK